MGDSVYLKLQPYVQTSVATRASHKLSFRYFGPYQIVAKVGNVAYKLLLPATTTIHPVFHVSQLKKAIPPNFQVSTDLPRSTTDDSLRFPVKILQRRLKAQGTRLASEVLIQWSSWPPSMATWELEDELKLQFPMAPAWGQAVLRRALEKLKITRSFLKKNYQEVGRKRRKTKSRPQEGIAQKLKRGPNE